MVKLFTLLFLSACVGALAGTGTYQQIDALTDGQRTFAGAVAPTLGALVVGVAATLGSLCLACAFDDPEGSQG